MFYEVVGVERMSGVSKKTGKAYDFTSLHLCYEDFSNKNLAGRSVMTVRPFADVLERSGYYPTVGDKIVLGFVPDQNGVAQLRSISLADV